MQRAWGVNSNRNNRFLIRKCFNSRCWWQIKYLNQRDLNQQFFLDQNSVSTELSLQSSKSFNYSSPKYDSYQLQVLIAYTGVSSSQSSFFSLKLETQVLLGFSVIFLDVLFTQKAYLLAEWSSFLSPFRKEHNSLVLIITTYLL